MNKDGYTNNYRMNSDCRVSIRGSKIIELTQKDEERLHGRGDINPRIWTCKIWNKIISGIEQDEPSNKKKRTGLM